MFSQVRKAELLPYYVLRQLADGRNLSAAFLGGSSAPYWPPREITDKMCYNLRVHSQPAAGPFKERDSGFHEGLVEAAEGNRKDRGWLSLSSIKWDSNTQRLELAW